MKAARSYTGVRMGVERLREENEELELALDHANDLMFRLNDTRIRLAGERDTAITERNEARESAALHLTTLKNTCAEHAQLQRGVAVLMAQTVEVFTFMRAIARKRSKLTRPERKKLEAYEALLLGGGNA